mmetsp:Transcript_21407/g.46876  ORF Transcript_21407/g.46876 Transcript_21407/m.46876 type:complete len:262 (+) Transcript_21407:167-952(+)
MGRTAETARYKCRLVEHRVLSHEDLVIIRHLHGHCFAESTEEQGDDERFMDRICCFQQLDTVIWVFLVDKQSQTSVGLATASRHLAKGGSLYVFNLCVMPKHRGLGLGHLLLRQVQTLAHEQRVYRVTGTVDTSYARLLQFYSALGAHLDPNVYAMPQQLHPAHGASTSTAAPHASSLPPSVIMEYSWPADMDMDGVLTKVECAVDARCSSLVHRVRRVLHAGRNLLACREGLHTAITVAGCCALLMLAAAKPSLLFRNSH